MPPILWNGLPLIRNGQPAVSLNCCCEEQQPCSCENMPSNFYAHVSLPCGCTGGTIPMVFNPSLGWWEGHGGFGCEKDLYVQIQCLNTDEIYIIMDCAEFYTGDVPPQFGAGTPGPLGGPFPLCYVNPLYAELNLFGVPFLLEECGCNFDGSETVTVILTTSATPP